MSDEIKISIEWLPGAVLPVRTSRFVTVRHLINFLQFSCFPDEKMYLFYNDELLDPSRTLQTQGITNGDVVKCKIIQDKEIYNKIFFSYNQSVQNEIARIADLIGDKESVEKNLSSSSSYSSYSDCDPYQYISSDNTDMSTSKDIPSDPLPIIWGNDMFDQNTTSG